MVLGNGIEILVHVGIDNIELNGEEFQRLKEEGSVVKCGQPIIKINHKFLESKVSSLITMVLITNSHNIFDVEYHVEKNVKSGISNILDYKIR